MQRGGGPRSARQDERAQRIEPRVERIDRALERLHLRRRDAQRRARRFMRLAWQAEVGAEIEQIVLDARQRRLDREIGGVARMAHGEDREADR